MTELEPRYACRAWGCRERFYSRFDLDEHCDARRHHECEVCCERFTLAYYRDMHACAHRGRPPTGATLTSGGASVKPFACGSATGATAAAATVAPLPLANAANRAPSGVVHSSVSHSVTPMASSRPPSSSSSCSPSSSRGTKRSDSAIDLTMDDNADDFLNSPVASLKPLTLRDWASYSR